MTLICVDACGSSLFICPAVYYTIVWIYHTTFICSYVGALLDCFLFVEIAKQFSRVIIPALRAICRVRLPVTS